MVAMPVLVLQDIIDIIFVIGSQAESTVLPLAFVIHRLCFTRLAFGLLLASLVASQIWVEVVVKCWEQLFKVSCQRELFQRIKCIRINVKVLKPVK